MNTIKTLSNQVEVTFHYDTILSHFDVYEIEVPSIDEKQYYKKFYTKIKKHFNPEARCVKWSHGTQIFIIMLKKGTQFNKSDFNIKKAGLAQIREISDKGMFSMMLSIMRGRSAFFELEGNPYDIYYPYSFTPSKTADMLALQVQLKENEDGLFMTLGATSFKKVRSPKLDHQYYVEECGVLRPYNKEKDAKKTIYQKGSKGNTKASIPFLYLDGRFKESKTYFFHKIAEEITTYLGEYMSLKFVEDELTVYSEGKDKKRQNERLDEMIVSYIKQIDRINIAILDPRCKEQAAILKDELNIFLDNTVRNLFDDSVDISISEHIDIDVPNISLALSAEYYQESNENDPYSTIDRSTPVQNYTCDEPRQAKEVGKVILGVILKELAIKCELYGYPPFVEHTSDIEGLTFFSIQNYQQKEDSKIVYSKAFLEDGKIKTTHLDQEESANIEMALYELPKNEYPEFVISDKEGNMVLGTRTPIFPLPDFNSLTKAYEETTEIYYFDKNDVIACADQVQQYHFKSSSINEGRSDRESFIFFVESISTVKGVPSDKLFSSLKRASGKLKKALEDLARRPLRFLPRGAHKEAFNGLIGITYKRRDFNTLYHVGSPSGNLAETIGNNSPYRKIIPIEGEIDILDILPLMEYYFVKNKDFTVLPYPIKYAREGYLKNRVE